MHVKLVQAKLNISFFSMTVYLLVLTLLISLGFWQLERALEKRLLLQHQQKQLNSSVKLSSTTDDNSKLLRFRQVSAEGIYDTEKQFLIDNQIIKGKTGYLVMTPFILKGSTKAVLVNRGWLPAHPNRAILPEITLTKNQSDIIGRINYFPRVGLKLKGADIPSKGWPSVVQIVENSILAEKLGYDLFSFQIELNPEQPQGYYRHWMENTIMPAEKHIGYAVQWFGLAITLTILFFWHSRKKISQ